MKSIIFNSCVFFTITLLSLARSLNASPQLFSEDYSNPEIDQAGLELDDYLVLDDTLLDIDDNPEYKAESQDTIFTLLLSYDDDNGDSNRNKEQNNNVFDFGQQNIKLNGEDDGDDTVEYFKSMLNIDLFTLNAARIILVIGLIALLIVCSCTLLYFILMFSLNSPWARKYICCCLLDLDDDHEAHRINIIEDGRGIMEFAYEHQHYATHHPGDSPPKYSELYKYDNNTYCEHGYSTLNEIHPHHHNTYITGTHDDILPPPPAYADLPGTHSKNSDVHC